MAVSVEEFIEYLAEIGFMAPDEIEDFLEQLPLNEQPSDARKLVREMLQHKKLTKFQADFMFKGKTKRLVVGNYVVLDKLGKGGMGRVYKAKHRRMERVVALKMLPFSARQSSDAIQRFQREVKAAARLVHPNIVTAYDADEADGRYYLVMEYVDGCDLLTFVKKRGPLSLRRAVDYIVQAAEGLDYAHSAKVIHLDIKPANLLLDKSNTVKVLDMGLARIDDVVAGGGSASAEALIQDGKIMGTVDYVSPERVDDVQAVDHRADIYSLGCTLYHLLTARPPFRGDTLRKRIQAHRLQPIPSLRDARRGVPKSLDAAFQRMLAKKPQDRYSSMREVISDLTACIEEAERQLAARKAAKGDDADDPQRRAAQSILAAGGTLQVSVNGRPEDVDAPHELPSGEIQITLVDLEHNELPDGGLLQNLEGLAGIQEVNLNSSSVGDEQLKHLAGLTSLQVLRLGNTQITDAGLKHIQSLDGLRLLWLENTAVTSEGLEHISGLSKLKYLRLKGTQVSKAALEHVQRLTSLAELELEDTTLTSDDVEALKATLPKCKITVSPS